MTPQEKRRRTIIERYGSYKNMLANRDRGDLVLGGINGGRKSVAKGFATWDKTEFKAFVTKRKRDERGRFIKEKDGSETERRKV